MKKITFFVLITMGVLSCGSSGSEGGIQPAKAGEICGGIAGISCEESLFCQYQSGSCGESDASGTCVLIADGCIELFQPVCGCDGKTYSNACKAQAASVSVKSEGECSSS